MIVGIVNNSEERKHALTLVVNVSDLVSFAESVVLMETMAFNSSSSITSKVPTINVLMFSDK